MSEEFKLEEKIATLKQLKDAIDEVLVSIEKKTARNALFDTKGAEGLKTKQDARVAAEMDELQDLLALIDIHIIDNAGVRAELIANGSQELNAAIRALTDQAFKDAVKKRAGLDVQTKSGKVMEELDQLEGKEFKFKTVEEEYTDAEKREAELTAELADLDAYSKVREKNSKEEIIAGTEEAPKVLEDAKTMLEEAKKVQGINLSALKIEELLSELDSVPTRESARYHMKKKPTKAVMANREKYSAYAKKLKAAVIELKKIAEINPEVAGLVAELEKNGIQLTPDAKEITFEDKSRDALKSVLENLSGIDCKAVVEEYATTKTQSAYGKMYETLEKNPIFLFKAEDARNAAIEALKRAETNGEPIPDEVVGLVEAAVSDPRLGKIDSLEAGMNNRAAKYKELADLRAKIAKLGRFKNEKRAVDTKSIRIAGTEIENLTVKNRNGVETAVNFSKYEGFQTKSKDAIYDKLVQDENIQKSLTVKYESQFKTSKLFASVRDFFYKIFTGRSHEEAKKRMILEGMITDAVANRKAEERAENAKKPWELDEATKAKVQEKQKQLGQDATTKARTAVVEKGKTAKEAFDEQQAAIDDEGIEI